MLGRGKKLAVASLSMATLLGVAAIAPVSSPASAANGPDATDSARTKATGSANANALPRLAASKGAAFAMTNRGKGNRIITYRRAPSGTLTRVGSVSTRGYGIDTDLDTQGGLRLSSHHRYLYAVNAGSDNISVFAVRGTHLRFLQKVYAGDEPNSLTIHDDLLYVLNGSVAGNGIRGFTVAPDGTLTRLPHSTRLLSSPIAVPGEVRFSPDGSLLLVTQKTTNVELSPRNAIDVFRVGGRGLPTAVPRREASYGLRPFSLAFRNNSQVLVVESFNAAPARSAVSSYQVSSTGALDVISGSIENGQTDSCWVVITKDDRYAFTANFGSGTISNYRFRSGGRVQLIDGRAAFLGIDSQPVDLDLAAGSRYLYLLLRGTGGVAAFKVRDDGSLYHLNTTTGGLPVADGASGLAVY